ncbi:hypothetical protein F5Y09DRAFT_238235 [Xylaria sp. FL1042]|nr:hypothetical protein F5Y09DRAFT_238235 [Xylaria sp. FL1042]
MSWAARRTTFREEDEAYCLLGIFNVNMPLIYGEGVKAFRRLQETLAREYPKDHSLFAWGKVVRRLSNEVDEYQAFGLKPLNLQHKPDEVERELFGFLAKHPSDFQHSGRLVCAPGARYYFWSGVNTISAVAGDTVHVNLPIFRGVIIARHLKHPPIVQLFSTNFIILQCGEWNDLHTDFRFVVVPIFNEQHSSRFDEIVVSDLYTLRCFISRRITNDIRNLEIRPMLPLSSRSGDIIIRRISSSFNMLSVPLLIDDEFSFLRGSIEVPSSLKGAFIAITFNPRSVEGVEGYGLRMTALRLKSLDHSHEDSTQGRNCGKLTFRLSPLALSGEDTRVFSVINKKGNSRVVVTKEELKLMSCRDVDVAHGHVLRNCANTAYENDMALPRDEWTLSIIGFIDVYISIERMFVDEYDSDSDDDDPESGNRGSHPFIDVLDLVVRKNLDKDDTVEEAKMTEMER